jgi:MoaA/NifB/PqqE/SkfB family radical SAM enzyme
LARRLGFDEITLVTNGVRLADGAYVDRLVRSGLGRVRLSVHGPTAELHDGIVAIPGAFGKVLAAESNLRRAGVPVGMNYVLIRRNHAELEAFARRFVIEGATRDLIVYFPHYRGMMALNAASDGVDYDMVRPSVLRAADALSAAGRLDALWLANFPPCAAPGLIGRLLDWELGPAGTTSMIHPEGHASDLAGMKEGQKIQADVCGACALGSRCLGVDREYALLGAAGLRALAGAPS